MSNPHPHETALSVELTNDAPIETKSRLERINIMASWEMLNYIDSVTKAIYETTGCRVSRSELIRGVLGGFIDHNPKFTGCTSESHFRRAVGRLFDAFAQAQRAKSSTPRPAANTVPALRQPQANGAARPTRASERVETGNGKPVQATTPLSGDQDDEVQDQADSASDFDFDAYMKARRSTHRE
jgi:hypothetical protein